MSEWLRRWTRNPLGSARRASNPLAVDWVWRTFSHDRQPQPRRSFRSGDGNDCSRLRAHAFLKGGFWPLGRSAMASCPSCSLVRPAGSLPFRQQVGRPPSPHKRLSHKCQLEPRRYFCAIARKSVMLRAAALPVAFSAGAENVPAPRFAIRGSG